MKKLCFLTIILIAALQLYAQQYKLDPSDETVCPNAAITYTLQYLSSDGSYYDANSFSAEWEISHGTIFIGSTNYPPRITIKWDEGYDNGSITAYHYVGGSKVDYAFVYPTINSISHKTPGAINGNTTVLMGEGQENYTLNDSELMKYPNGTTVNRYSWIIPAGWKIGNVVSDGVTPYTGQYYHITVTPHPTNGGVIKVAGENWLCGECANSKYQTLTIDRAIPNFSISLVSTNNTFLQGDTRAITLGVPSYSWATYS